MILTIKSAGRDTELMLLSAESIDASAPVAIDTWESGRMLADHLLSRLHDLITGQNHDWQDLTGIVIYAGPGSFTSLRIAHTVANTLASGLNIRVAGASGEHWLRDGLNALPKRMAGEPVWPLYGGDAHITVPKR